MRINSKLGERKDIVRIGRYVERWCKDKLGTNGRKKYAPIVTYYKSLSTDDCMGEYRWWDNELIVYYNNCRTVTDLIQTILHEWQHQLQPMSKYEKMLDAVGYEEHPLEKEAEAAEALYKQVWLDIKHKINK